MRTTLLNALLLRFGGGFTSRTGGRWLALVLPLVLLLVLSLNDVTQAQNLVWAKSSGGPTIDEDNNTDEGFDIAVDGAGNSYITGRFFVSATFGAGEANETTLARVQFPKVAF